MSTRDRRLRRITELADAVVIDEAHRLYVLPDTATRPKMVFMLAATPINNQLSDFRHMVELFTRQDEA
jgi:hypothetical protein